MRRPVPHARFRRGSSLGSHPARSLAVAGLCVLLACASSGCASSPSSPSPVAAGGVESDGSAPSPTASTGDRAGPAAGGSRAPDAVSRDGGPSRTADSATGVSVGSGVSDGGASADAGALALGDSALDAGAPRVATSPSSASSGRLADRPSPPWCNGDLPPIDMLRDNIASTQLSGIAEIVASSITSLNGTTPAPTTGYVNLRYEVRVLRWLSGSGPDTLVLHQGAEAGATPARPGRLLVFSACTSKTAIGGAYEPDVGYFFHLDPQCLAAVETHAETAAKRARISGKPKGRACTH